MSLINSLPEKPHLADVFKKFPKGVMPLLEYHDILLREDSPLSIAERELIAALVSGLNGCSFCFGAHVRIANEFGVEPALFDDLLSDIDMAKVDEKLKPILKYVKKLTLSPAKIIKDDILAMTNAGWSDQAIYDAASVCALFNFMNRIVEGMGVVPSPSIIKDNSNKPSKSSYRDFGRSIGVI